MTTVRKMPSWIATSRAHAATTRASKNMKFMNSTVSGSDPAAWKNNLKLPVGADLSARCIGTYVLNLLYQVGTEQWAGIGFPHGNPSRFSPVHFTRFPPNGPGVAPAGQEPGTADR